MDIDATPFHPAPAILLTHLKIQFLLKFYFNFYFLWELRFSLFFSTFVISYLSTLLFRAMYNLTIGRNKNEVHRLAYTMDRKL